MPWLPVGAAAPSSVTVISWSGCGPDPRSAAGSLGEQHGQPAGEGKGSGQDTEGSQEPAGCPAWFVRRWDGHLGGCPVGNRVALPSQLPLEGGVRGALLR